jgi:pyruvate,orthophosphate dikinase
MLQTRTGKRTGTAAVRIAVELVKAGVIDEATAVNRVNPDSLNHLLLPQLDPKAKDKPVAQGIAASPGAAGGHVMLTADDVVAYHEKNPNEPILLVRKETSPEDVAGMHLAAGILTATGGKASHAAVVARGWGKPCIVGCEAIQINEKAKTLTIAGQTIKEGDFLTINGATGDVYIGRVPTVAPTISGDFATLMKWADSMRTLKVRTNADTPADAAKAREFGAEGIGLCRTEHMFFGKDRIGPMREMILADDETGRRAALAKIEPFQREDFIGLFEAMDGLPVTIRLLDPPLHEFLPHDQKGQAEVAKALGVSVEKVAARVEQLHEFNPMMGFRGCRLPIVYPEIGEMQVRAIIEAAITVKKQGKTVLPEIMVPLIGTVEELAILKKQAIALAEELMTQAGTRVDYLIGTMIEIPRAALIAEQVAHEAQFFSFGTNDLTQLTFGYSRDDIKGFMPTYLKEKILPVDPFQSLDVNGVGQLVEIGVQKGRAGRKAKHGDHLKVGICGEHGGDPDSVAFCHKVGLDYVSCSPFRVPIARLAAAQAALSGGTTTARDK